MGCLWTKSQGQSIWNGLVSDDWNNPNNWTPSGVPASGTQVAFSSPTPNPCVLQGNQTIQSLVFSGGTLNLNGFQLIMSGSAAISGGTFRRGTLAATNFSQVSQTQFTGHVYFLKTGGGNNVWDGGNHFDTLSIELQTNASIQLANLLPDTVWHQTHLISQANGDIHLAQTATGNYFGGDIHFNQNGNADMTIGRLGGTSTLHQGALKSLGFGGNLIQIQYLNQTHALGSDSLSASDIRFLGSNMLGDLVLYTSDELRLDSSRFLGNNRMRGHNINVRNRVYLSSASNTTLLQKLGGGNNTLNAAALTAGNLILSNPSSSFIRFNGLDPDTILGSLRLELNNSGDIEIFRRSTGSFVQGPVEIQNNGSAALYFGRNGGSATQGPTSFSTVGTFTGQVLSLSNYVQSPGDSGVVVAQLGESFSAINSSFTASFDITTPNSSNNNDIQVQNSSFERDLSLISGADLIFSGSNRLGTLGRPVVLEMGTAANSNQNWNGSLFVGGPATLTNHSGAFIRTGFGQADTFLSDLTLIQTGSGDLRLSEQTSGNLFHGNISIQHSGSGSIYFGRNGGSSTMGPFDFSTTTVFTGPRFELNNFTQAPGGTGNLQIQTEYFEALNTSLRGSISVETAAGNGNNDINLNNILVEGSATFLSGADLIINGTAQFTSASTDSLTLGIGPSSSSSPNWSGGFYVPGHTTIVNNSANQLRMATLVPDTFLAGISLRNLAGGTIRLSDNAPGNFIDGPITLESTSGGQLHIGFNGGGTSVGPHPINSVDTLQVSNFRILNLNQALGGSGQINVKSDQVLLQNINFQGGLFAQTDTGAGGNDITLDQVEIAGNVEVISGADLLLTNGTRVSTLPNTSAYFSQGPSASNTTNWFGDIFSGGPFTLENYSNQIIRFAQAGVADTFNAGLTLSNFGSNTIYLAHNGAGHLINGNFEINSSSGSGGIDIGGGDGTLSHQNGTLSTGTGFLGASLNWEDFSQAPSAQTNLNLTANQIQLSNVQLNGDFFANTPAGNQAYDILLNNSSISGNLSLDAGADLILNGSNQLATDSGATAILIQGSFANTGNNNWNGGNTFGNLSLTNNSNQNIRLASSVGDDINGSAIFTLNGSGNLQFAFNGQSTLSGDMTVNGTNTAGFSINAGAGNLRFDGDSSQNFDGPPGFEFALNTFEMNSNGRLKLDKPMHVNGTLIMTKGVLETDAVNMLILDDESVISTLGSDSSYISGPMQYRMNTNSGARTTLLFPIGKDSSYHPVMLEVSHTSTTEYIYQAEVFNQNASVVGWVLPADSSITHVSTERLYTIDRFRASDMSNQPSLDLRTGGSGPQITLYYDSTDYVPDPLNLRIVKSNNTGFWENIGGFGSAPGSGFITSSGSPSPFTSFSDFSFGNGPGGVNPLPISLVEFTAQVKDQKVLLKWITETEINNAYFTIERSQDLSQWQEIAHQIGAGNSNKVIHYQDLDLNPLSGISYYRLKQTDFDGTFSYSDPVSVNLSSNASAWSVYPNPSNGQIQLARSLSIATEAYLMDLSGRRLHTWSIPKGDEVQTLEFPTLPAGTYFLAVDGTFQRILRY